MGNYLNDINNSISISHHILVRDFIDFFKDKWLLLISRSIILLETISSLFNNVEMNLTSEKIESYFTPTPFCIAVVLK